MATAIETLWKQALKTFGGRSNAAYTLCQNNLDNLWSLINKITADDVKLDNNILDYVKKASAPMSSIHIFENKDITMTIFILRHGITMPMHNHPCMYGFLKVLTGVVNINCYSLKVKLSDDHILKPNEELEAIRHRPILVNKNSPACFLTPHDRNLHEITCMEGPAAFLDILSPPYEPAGSAMGLRECTYFKIIKPELHMETDDIEDVLLKVIEQPSNFYSKNMEYSGPPLA